MFQWWHKTWSERKRPKNALWALLWQLSFLLFFVVACIYVGVVLINLSTLTRIL